MFSPCVYLELHSLYVFFLLGDTAIDIIDVSYYITLYLISRGIENG
jgi:hypothetical protein